LSLLSIKQKLATTIHQSIRTTRRRTATAAARTYVRRNPNFSLGRRVEAR
jgi:hypothetical protein